MSVAHNPAAVSAHAREASDAQAGKAGSCLPGLEWQLALLERTSIGRKDAVGVIPALARVTASLSQMPLRVWQIAGEHALGQVTSTGVAISKLLPATGPVVPTAAVTDKRFADPAWTDNAGFYWIRENFRLWSRSLNALVDTADVDPADRAKAKFVVNAAIDALAPTNGALTNPVVLRRAAETNGQSLLRGLANLLDDLRTNGGRPRQVAADVHRVGENIAVTPGKVVFRNDLMELIQYTPTTPTVHQIPLLLSPPWINKYYIMDLAPGRSFVEFAVAQGHTVFLISYRNPDESMRTVNLDDYLVSGPLAALDVITDITGSAKVNLLGLCLGGTLTMSTLAYLNAAGDDRVHCATFLNTLIDFAEPGALGVFTDEATISKLETQMDKSGFLDGGTMRQTFDALRANDLIWNYVVANWLLGEDPPAFDILTWNADSTRMPAAMHSFYLRSCYLENRLARGNLSLAGTALDLASVTQDQYFLSAEQDHIAPWRSSYQGARLTAGNVRFVLSNSGHIAGIVNPPHPKARHRVAVDGAAGSGSADGRSGLPASPDEWLATTTTVPTTWWLDWASWIGERAGRQVAPPPLGTDRHPVLDDAPGRYVRQTTE